MLLFFSFFKERLGLKLTHKRITTKVVLPFGASVFGTTHSLHDDPKDRGRGLVASIKSI